MMYRWAVGSFSVTCLCLVFSSSVGGQQISPVRQGEQSQASSFQSPKGAASSPQSTLGAGKQVVPAVTQDQPSPRQRQPVVKPQAQPAARPNVQELPSVWPQSPPPVVAQPTLPTQQQEQTEQPLAPPTVTAVSSPPGYLGANTRNFYRERFCMHALTIRGVEVETVLPGSPAAVAGLRPAREMTTRETAVAVAAGLLTYTPVAAVAPSLVRFSGGLPHGDIILAVNGRRVASQNEFQEEIQRARVQATVHLTIHRGETNVQLPVRLTEWPAPAYANAQ